MGLRACLLAIVLGLTPAASKAQSASDFPSRRIHIVLPYPAGGIVDVATRIVTDRLSEKWSQPIVIEPKPTASGSVAWDQVSRAVPDGYTWTFMSPAVIVTPRTTPGLQWNEKSFVPIGAIAWAPSVVTVNPDVPAATMAEFIAYARNHPGKLNWANPGIGTSQHLDTAILLNAAQLDIVEVQYRGQPPGLFDLLANRIQMQVVSIGLVHEHIKLGKLKALAVLGKQRSPLLPGVPTMSEAGYPDINVVAWYGLGAPRDTPQPVVEKIVAAINDVVKDPAVRASLDVQGLQAVDPMNASELASLVAADTEKYARVIAEAGIKSGN